MKIDLVAYESYFRILIDGEKTPVTIEFGFDKNEVFDVIEDAIEQLVLMNIIEDNQLSDMCQALYEKLG